jgi:ferredoxin
MADANERWEDNVPGKWYVDKSCILCSLCEDLAPDSFKEGVEGDHDVVHCQPATPDQEAACEEAMDQCPVAAIGNDG